MFLIWMEPSSVMTMGISMLMISWGLPERNTTPLPHFISGDRSWRRPRLFDFLKDSPLDIFSDRCISNHYLPQHSGFQPHSFNNWSSILAGLSGIFHRWIFQRYCWLANCLNRFRPDDDRYPAFCREIGQKIAQTAWPPKSTNAVYSWPAFPFLGTLNGVG